ncbi:hypothetical protein IMY05_014G0068200 [Salix suchowensis]|nr:hypothetical protein IMY05_014G0068200 [Salix suchowensis]
MICYLFNSWTKHTTEPFLYLLPIRAFYSQSYKTLYSQSIEVSHRNLVESLLTSSRLQIGTKIFVTVYFWMNWFS